MKKALVLGVLAIFAISIANVNAQDRTTSKQQPKATKEVKKESVETKAAPATKKAEPAPAVKKAEPAPAPTTKKAVTPTKKNTISKNKKAYSTEVSEIEKSKAIDEKKVVDPNEMDAKKLEQEKKSTQDNATPNTRKSIQENSTSKNVTTKNNVNNSVPPTPKQKKGNEKAASATSVTK